MVDIFSESFELVTMEGGSPELSSSIEKMDNVWSGEKETPVSDSNTQEQSLEDEES